MAIETDTRQRILDAARELIHTRSYADVGIAAICERAGVQKGSFYHFFPSKQELTLTVLDTFYEKTEERIGQAFEADIPSMARLERMGELAYEAQKTLQADTGKVLGCAFGNLATELSTQDEAIRKKVDHIFGKFRKHIAMVLQEASDRGDISGIDVAATAEAMLAYFEGVMMMAKTQNDLEVLRRLLPAMAQIRIPAKD